MTRQGGPAVGTVHCIEFAVLLPLRGRERHAAPLQWRVRSAILPGNLQLPMALATRKGHAASVRRQSRQRLRSERRYRRNWFLRFFDALYELSLPSRDCHVGRWPPRNDTSGGTALTTVHPIDLAVLLPLRGRAGHAPPLQTHQCRPIPNFSFLIPNMINKAAPHHSARAFVERFFVEARFEKCRRALCTSSFSNRRIGEKYPAKAEGAMMRCCHK